MEAKQLQARRREIVRRLSAVNLSEVRVDEPVIAAALGRLLRALDRPAMPIRWARDAQQAHALAARPSETSAKRYQELHPLGTFGSLFQRDRGGWVDARDEAKAAAHGGALELVKRLMHGYPVRPSVPWRLYRGRMTSERGWENSPEHSPAWQAAGDAFEYAARAAAECAWAQTYHENYTEPEFSNFPIEEFEEDWFPFVDAYEAGLWLFWITETEVIALSRPIVQLKGEQLHSERGPAVRWPDGEEQYFVLNDAHVPREIVETPASKLDPQLILRERNAEVRRELVRKIGIDRVCRELQAECLDRRGNYELLLLDLQDGRLRPFLKMKNPSIGVYHIEGVAPECRTVAEALAWRNQTDLPPSVLT
jgi:hypothetical protein